MLSTEHMAAIEKLEAVYVRVYRAEQALRRVRNHLTHSLTCQPKAALIEREIAEIDRALAPATKPAREYADA